MENRNLFALLESLPADRERLAIEMPGGARLTYGELFARAGRIASFLRENGLEPGDRVAVQVEKSVEALILYLACVRAGGVFLPLNSAYTMTEIEYFLRDSEPRIIVAAENRAGPIKMIASGAKVFTLEEDGSGSLMAGALAKEHDFQTVERRGEDLAAILYTSGTTGRSKGAMLTHDNLVSNSLTLIETWRYTREDVLIHALPIYHTHGLFVATNVTLFAGATMIFLPKFDAGKIISQMDRATVLMGVPTFYVRLLESPELTAASARKMRLFVSGSAPLLAETHRAWKERTGHVILERYGMTETNMITSNPYDRERRPGAVGFPLNGVSVRITDPETGHERSREEVGMIEVQGPNVFKGYWRMPEKTAQEFRPNGFFITGDLGKIDADGYVHIVGRGKDLIITGGFNVYPKEVEAEIDGIAGVRESAVIGLPHRDFGEGVTAVVVPLPGAEVDEAAILRALENRLARFKQPKCVLFIEALPRNSMGKVQKNILRERFADLYRT